MASCAHCGSELPDGSRFCPVCGRAVTAGEAGRPGTAWWPPEPFTLLATLVAVGGVVLLARGAWSWGIVVLLAAAVVLFAGREVERRAAGRAFGLVRARTAAAGEAVVLRSRAHMEVFRARRQLAELEAERGRLFRDLGQAVFAGDEAGMKAARAALEAVTDHIAGKEAEIHTLIRQTEQRVERVQAPVRPTERLEPEPQAEVPPEPARVPEPWPPPDEADIPEPPAPEPGEPPPAPAPEHPPTPGRGGGEHSS